MGVLQRFERRLEGLVEGAFARVFGGVVQPVEVAAALQREAADKKAIVGQGRVLVPNVYVVELGEHDFSRMTEYDEPLRAELASMVREHAEEQGWSFVGKVAVSFEQSDDIDTGVFRVRSAVVADPAKPSAPQTTGVGRPRLVLPAGSGSPERTVLLTQPVTVIGRGAEADLRLHDTGVSRRHLELHVEGEDVRLADLRSTNGTLVNGRKVSSTLLVDGDRIEVGATPMVFKREA